MVAGFLVICCRRTIPSTRVILRLGTSCVVSIPCSGSSPSCESGYIVDNLLRRWINFNLSLHCSIVPSAEKRADVPHTRLLFGSLLVERLWCFKRFNL